MKQFSYVLTNENAMQIRPMSNLMREAARFSSKVRLINGAKTAALQEMRAVMGLDMQCGSKVTVTVEGKDEEAAVAAIQSFFVDNM
ncbi:MAG TPA: HPr family phosphocarrier protein [Candidatus Ventricola intestinavium]|nr:HPr family phosphocarrier protein [Candidatus Ventricola intestinavium]